MPIHYSSLSEVRSGTGEIGLMDCKLRDGNRRKRMVEQGACMTTKEARPIIQRGIRQRRLEESQRKHMVIDDRIRYAMDRFNPIASDYDEKMADPATIVRIPHVELIGLFLRCSNPSTIALLKAGPEFETDRKERKRIGKIVSQHASLLADALQEEIERRLTAGELTAEDYDCFLTSLR
jgi:hypothetical protein